MSPENFVYWLQGYLELSDAAPNIALMTLTPAQVGVIKDHIKLVLNKQTPFQEGIMTTNLSSHYSKLDFDNNPPASC